jgi:hypothetical protein
MPDIPQDWCMNMAKLEDGQEIGAGSPDHLLRGGSMRDYLEQRERDLEAALSLERDENSQLRAALTAVDDYLRPSGAHGAIRQSIRKFPVVRALLDE